VEERELKPVIASELDGLTEKIGGCFKSRKSLEMARKYMLGLMGNAERKNGWQLAEQMGEKTPYKVRSLRG